MDPKQENAQAQPKADVAMTPKLPETAPDQQPTPTEQQKPEAAPTATQDASSASTPASTPPQPDPKPATPPTPPASTPPKETAKGEKRVSLRTVLLIVFLAILAAVLLFIALKPAKQAMVQNAAPTPTTKPSQAHSTLSLVLPTASATTSGSPVGTKTVNVVLTTQSNKVSGVQVEIAYDPTVLTNVTVKPGDFFTKPLILLNQVDTKNGKINYALGIQPTADQVTGTGTVAVISYTPLPTASASQTTLKFLPKTQVVEQGVSGSVLEKSFDLSVPVAGLTPSATNLNQSGATKAQ